MKALPRSFVDLSCASAALEAELPLAGAVAFAEYARRLVGFWSRFARTSGLLSSLSGLRRPLSRASGLGVGALEVFYVRELRRLVDAQAAWPRSPAISAVALEIRNGLHLVGEGGSGLAIDLQAAVRRLMHLLAVEHPAEYENAAIRFLESRPCEPLDGRELLVHDLLFGGARGPVESTGALDLSSSGFSSGEELDVLFGRHAVVRPCDGLAWPSIQGVTVSHARKMLAGLPKLLCLALVDGAPCALLGRRTAALPSFGMVSGRNRVERAWVAALDPLEARAMAAVRECIASNIGTEGWGERVEPYRLDSERCHSQASSRDLSIVAVARAWEATGRPRDEILSILVTARIAAAGEQPGVSKGGCLHEVFRHYLAIGRPSLGADSDFLFVRQGGGPLSAGRVARILGWDLADVDLRPRVSQLRNGRGAYLMLGAARGGGSPLDRLGEGALARELWLRVLDGDAWPWPYREAARRRLKEVSWSLGLVRALLGLPPGHPFRQDAVEALQREPAWLGQLEPVLVARGLFEASDASVDAGVRLLQKEKDPERVIKLVAAFADALVVAWLQGRSDFAEAWARALLPLWPLSLQTGDPAVYRVASIHGDVWFATREDALASIQAGDVKPADQAEPSRVQFDTLLLDRAPDLVREVCLRLMWAGGLYNWPLVLPRLAEGLGGWRSCAEWVGNLVRSGLQDGRPFWCASMLSWLAEGQVEVFRQLVAGQLRNLLASMSSGWSDAERARFILLASSRLSGAPIEVGVGLPTLTEASSYYVLHPLQARALSQAELSLALVGAPEESWPAVVSILGSGDMREVVQLCLDRLIDHVIACVEGGDIAAAARWAEQLLAHWEPQMRGRRAWHDLSRLEFEQNPLLERFLGCALEPRQGGLPDAVISSICLGEAPPWTERLIRVALTASPRLVVSWILRSVGKSYLSTKELEAAVVRARDAGHLEAMLDEDRVLLALRLGNGFDVKAYPALASIMWSPADSVAEWILDRPEAATWLEPHELASLLLDAPEGRLEDALRIAFQAAARERFSLVLGHLCVALVSNSTGSAHRAKWASLLVQNWAPQVRNVIASVKVSNGGMRLKAKMRHGVDVYLAGDWKPIEAAGDAAIEDLLMAMMRTRQGWVRDWIWAAYFAKPADSGRHEWQTRRVLSDGATPKCLAHRPPKWVAPALARLIEAEPRSLASSLAHWFERHPSKVARADGLSDEILAKLGRCAGTKIRLTLARQLLTAVGVPDRLRALAWEMCQSVAPNADAADLLGALMGLTSAKFLELLRVGVDGGSASGLLARRRLSWLLDHGLAAALSSSVPDATDSQSGHSDAITADALCAQALDLAGVVALVDVPRLLPCLSVAAWSDYESKLVTHLEASPDTCQSFWVALLNEIRGGRLSAGLVTDQVRTQLRTSFVRTAASETFATVPPAAKVLATAWIAEHSSSLTQQADLLVQVASHEVAEVRAHAIGSIVAATITKSQLLRIAESGHRDVDEAISARLSQLHGHELTESLAAMLDSPVASVRALALQRLRQEPSLSAIAAVASALLSSPFSDVEGWALSQLEVGILGSDVDVSRLQELVMTRLQGGASLRAAIRKQVSRGSAISTELLLRISRGPHSVDAQWAAALLVERAIAGQSVPSVTLLGMGGDPCN